MLPPVAVAVVAVRHRAVLADGLGQLRSAAWPWLLVAVGATCLTWVAAAFSRQGAVVQRLPGRRLLATQFAAGAANHMLPSGLGATAVNLRFLTVCGVPAARSSAALALFLLAESVGRLGLLAVLLVAFPGALRLGPMLPQGGFSQGLFGPVAVCAAALAVVAPVTVMRVGRVRRHVRDFVRGALAEARSVHLRPARALALWGGSFAFAALQATALTAVGRSLGLSVPPAHLALAYLAATVAVALVPTPGGVGSVEAALVVTLVATGSPTATATAVVLLFRLITVWLPLVPGALTLGLLVRLRVI
ncbi:lysylphosphatidylglycerol synthase domain-containing protein [Streptomyces sp. NPDC008150]|uniref:lysylphosphatidylglycerol synthase transmembrane domain-containing protein n=1 Tax=Streptomyces sp. NPDC008150 TaxID=3364816 RepID=UPI0036E8DE6D